MNCQPAELEIRATGTAARPPSFAQPLPPKASFAQRLSRSVFLFLLTLAPLQAFDPVLSTITPRGGQLGTELTITLHGERLFAPEELLLYKPGLTVKSLTKSGKEHKKATAVITIAPDAELGEHPIRLRCQGGVTYMRTFWVGQFPTIREKEPNNEFAAPQEIPLNSTVHGVADKEDADYYRVRATKGQRLSVEVEGMRLGRVLFDPYISILDAKRFELASADDTALLRRDSCASVLIPEDGAYTVLVRESSYQGQPACNYRLHIGEFPRPTAIYPPGARPGEERAFTFIGDARGDQVATITMPPAPQVFTALVPEGAWRPPSGIPVRVSALPGIEEKEPNEGGQQATPLEAPSPPIAFHGILSKKGDKDWFRFTAKKGQKLRTQVHSRSLRSPLDSVIIVRNIKGGKALGYNDDQAQGIPDSRLDFEIPEDGIYLVNIRDQLYRSGPDFTYRIEITPRAPQILASLPYGKRADSQMDKMICVARGNRVARVVNITRQNIGCDIALDPGELPNGLRLDHDTAPRNVTSFPLVLEAAADAPVSGFLHALTIRDPKSGLTGPLRETIHHIEVNNAGTYHTTTGERHAIAVITEAPFHLDLHVPPVPLVRNGTMNLRATVTRHVGFDGKIKVTLPWKPPGVGAPASVAIPKDQDEVTIRINANATAPVRGWRICAQGEATGGKGRVLASSALVPLEVAEPYLNMAIAMTATEPGKNTELLCKLEHLKPFEGKAIVTLHGLPHGVTAPSRELTAGQPELVFPLAVTGEARKGKHSNIFSQVIITANGHPIPHTVGSGGTLRIDPPPPAPKKASPKTTAPPKDEPPKPAAKKPLSRLEQLRQNKTP